MWERLRVNFILESDCFYVIIFFFFRYCNKVREFAFNFGVFWVNFVFWSINVNCDVFCGRKEWLLLSEAIHLEEKPRNRKSCSVLPFIWEVSFSVTKILWKLTYSMLIIKVLILILWMHELCYPTQTDSVFNSIYKSKLTFNLCFVHSSFTSVGRLFRQGKGGMIQRRSSIDKAFR